MKYGKVKLMLGLFTMGAFTVSGVTGCSNSSSSEETSSGENTLVYEDQTSDEELVSTTVTGTVTSIDDNEITLSIGGGMGSAPDMSDSESTSESDTPPDMPEDSGDSSTDTDSSDSSTDVSDDSSDTDSSDSSSGEVPDIPEDSTDSSSSEQETAILTINDESVIQITSQTSDTTEEGSLDDITEGSTLSIEIDDTGEITAITVSEGMSGGGDMSSDSSSTSSGVDSYDSVNEYSEDTTLDGDTVTSTGTDENAILVDGGNVTLNDVTVDRTSSDSTGGDNSSFYGVGAAILTSAGTTFVNGGTITTDASGGAGIFAYDSGVVYAADTSITTQQDTSGGIHVAGGGTLYAWDLDVSTNGASAAAIRSDRGGGTMVVDGGTYTSNGTGSPAVYCTADIAVNNATLTANGSEAICMEGLNTLHLFDCDLTGNMPDDDQNDSTWTIIVYQSMSGDSEVGNSDVQIVGGSITSENGGLLYTTNTECNILLSDVDITYSEDSEYFLMCTGNTNERGWGTEGENGSQCKFTADTQEMEGDVIWDSVSELDFYMTNGSTLTGAVVDDETYAGDGGDGYCNLTISDDSTWVVTGDSTLSTLSNAGTIVDADGNTVSIVGSDGTEYVSGTSDYTITVDSYNTTADTSNAETTSSWSDYEVDKPDELS